MIEQTADAVLLHTLNGKTWVAISQFADAGEFDTLTASDVWNRAIMLKRRGLLDISSHQIKFRLTEKGKDFVRTMLGVEKEQPKPTAWGTW